jgi:hypothetical protein
MENSNTPPKTNVVSVKEQDYLEEDKVIRNQNFACLSFISPESVIDNKNVFFFSEFIKDFSNKMLELFDNLKEKYKNDSTSIDSLKDYYEYLFNQDMLQAQYKYFIEENNNKLENEYLEKNNFQTSIRGVKVRGVYDTLKEAQVRSEILKRIDTLHNIYIGQVGCWLPFDPTPGNIEEQEYSETQLNTLMKKYKENETAKDEHFEVRKQEMMNRNKKEEPTIITHSQLEESQQEVSNKEIENEILDADPWVKKNILQNDDGVEESKQG